MSYVLMGIAVYALFAYVFEDLILVEMNRLLVIGVRLLFSMIGAFIVGGVYGLWFGLAVFGVSRIAARIDTYLSVVIYSANRRK